MLIITFKYRYRKQIVIGIFILFLLVGGTILTIFMFQSDKKDKSDLVVSTATNSLKKKSKKENKKVEDDKSEENNKAKDEIKSEK